MKESLALLAILAVICAVGSSAQQVGENGIMAFNLTIGKGGGNPIEGDGSDGMTAGFCIGYAGNEISGGAPFLGNSSLGCYPLGPIAPMCRYFGEFGGGFTNKVQQDFPLYMRDISSLLCQEPVRWNLTVVKWSPGCDETTFQFWNETEQSYPVMPDEERPWKYLFTDGCTPPDNGYNDATGHRCPCELGAPGGIGTCDTFLRFHAQIKPGETYCEVIVNASSPEMADGTRFYTNATFIMAPLELNPFCPTCNLADIPYQLYKVTEPVNEDALVAIISAGSTAAILGEQCGMNTADLNTLRGGQATIDIPGATIYCDDGSTPLLYLQTAVHYYNAAIRFAEDLPQNAVRYSVQAETMSHRGLRYICTSLGNPEGCVY